MHPPTLRDSGLPTKLDVSYKVFLTMQNTALKLLPFHQQNLYLPKSC